MTTSSEALEWGRNHPDRAKKKNVEAFGLSDLILGTNSDRIFLNHCPMIKNFKLS